MIFKHLSEIHRAVSPCGIFVASFFSSSGFLCCKRCHRVHTSTTIGNSEKDLIIMTERASSVHAAEADLAGVCVRSNVEQSRSNRLLEFLRKLSRGEHIGNDERAT